MVAIYSNTSLELSFPLAKGYATQSGALAKLAKHADALQGVSTVTVQRPTDGRWLPIVIYSHRARHLQPMALAAAGLCVAD